MNQPDLPTREQQRLVERELEPGEQLLWAAPARPRLFTAHSIAIILFAIFWCGALLYFMGPFFMGAASEHSGALGLLRILFLLPFLGAAYVIFWFSRQESRIHGGICAVTDRRALLLRQSRGTVIRTEWSGERLDGLDIRPRQGNRGDIILGLRELRSKNGTRIIPYGFHGIDNPEQIVALLRQAVPTAPLPPATEPPQPEWPRTADRTTRHNLETLLSPGETVRWIAPRHPRLFNPATGFLFIFGLIWSTVSFGILTVPADRIEGDMPSFVVVIFGILGLLALSSPWIHRAYARKQYYLFTDRRIIRYNPGLRTPSIQTRSYISLESTRLRIRPDGSGTLDLAYTFAKSSGMAETFTLDNIPDIRSTCTLARQLAAANNRTPPGEASP